MTDVFGIKVNVVGRLTTHAETRQTLYDSDFDFSYHVIDLGGLFDALLLPTASILTCFLSKVLAFYDGAFDINRHNFK